MSSFSNKGFKSLPLDVQKKIMKRSNKFESGGNGVLDPNYDTVEKIQAAYSSGAITEQQADIYQKAIDDAGGQYYTGLEGIGLTQADLKPMPEKMNQSLSTKDHNLTGKKEFNPMENISNMSPYILGLLKKDLSDKAKIKERDFGEEWAPEAYTRRGQIFPAVPTTGSESAQFKEYRNVLNKEWYGQGKPLQNELNLGQFQYGGNIFAEGGMMNQYAMGAQMPQGQMTDIPVTEFNAGGSHEANAMGGVYQGIANNGKPNLVEQGELKITIPGTDEQFIVSPKIKLDKATAEEFGLNKKHVGKDMVKIFKGLLRKNNFAEREGDSIVENSKQLEIMPYVAAHQKLTEIANAKDQAKKQEAFDKDMTQMMEKHPEYMEALLAQSQQPMQQEAPYPGDEAIMQQAAMQGGMPPMMATYGGNIHRYGSNMYDFGSTMKTIGAGAYGVGEGVLDTITGGLTDSLTDAGYNALQKAANKGATEDELARQNATKGFGNVAGAITGAVVTGGGQTASAVNEGFEGAGEGLSSIGELNDNENLIKAGNLVNTGAQLTSFINPGDAATGATGSGMEAITSFMNNPMTQQGMAAGTGMLNSLGYGGMKMGCGGMKYGKGGKMGCNCYKCGGRMHTYGGNMFNLGGVKPPSGPIITEGVMPIEEDLQTLMQNPYLSNESKADYLEGGSSNIMDTSLEEGIKDVTVEGGIGSSLLQLAPAVTSGIMAFSKPETYDAGDLGYKATTAPKVNYGQARRDTQQQAASAAKDIKNVGGAGYLGNRIANALNASKVLAQISQQEENTNKQMAYQNALQNAGRYQQAAAQAAMMTAQAQAAKTKAIQDFGATVGSLGSKLSADQMGAGYANIYSPDINFKYNPLGKSLLGKTSTNKEKKSKKKSS